MTARLVEKGDLSAKGLLNTVRKVFQKVEEPNKNTTPGPNRLISTTDCLMSAVALFKLKYPSLLQFDKDRSKEGTKTNLKNLFKIEHLPSDTRMRERLDDVEAKDIRLAFKGIFSSLQRGKVLEKYTFLKGKYLLLSDGTGYFSSKTVHCSSCNEKHHRDGSITYYHQFLSAVIAHPDQKEVIPICPEPIANTDGNSKNDCERNATERLLKDFRREYPHLPTIVVEDGLAANGPHIKLMKELEMSFITVVKPDGNKALSITWQTLTGLAIKSNK